MKETFVEYNFFIKEKEEEFFKNATIVLDSETLLTLYYYTDENRRDFFEILRDIKINNRLYLPYQIGFEFYQERERAMLGGKELPKKLLEGYKNAFEKLKNISSSSSSELSLFIKGRKKIIDTFNKKIENLDEIGKIRYEAEIPPGYLNKKEKNKLGDLIIWNDMIEYSKKNKNNILFVKNSPKENWIYEENGISYGANKKLLKEFKEKTEGQKFHIVTLTIFLDKIKTYLGIANTKELKQATQEIEKFSLFKNKFLANAQKRINEEKEIQDNINLYLENVDLYSSDFIKNLDFYLPIIMNKIAQYRDIIQEEQERISILQEENLTSEIEKKELKIKKIEEI